MGKRSDFMIHQYLRAYLQASFCGMRIRCHFNRFPVRIQYIAFKVAIMTALSIFMSLWVVQKTVAQGKEISVHLDRYYHFTELMRDPLVQAHLVRYQSNFDSTVQSILVLEPTTHQAKRLFFFFHGMDGDCGDGVIVRGLVNGVGAKVIVLCGRGASWVSDAFVFDATQVINEYSKGYHGYYLMGVSMGGSQALSLAGLLPRKLRESILGVIALIPGSDLLAIANNSSNQRVKNTLSASVNGNLNELRQRSPYYLIDRYKKNLPFIIFYNEDDTVLLSNDIEMFIDRLRKKHSVSTFTAPGEHHFVHRSIDYRKLFQELGRGSTGKKRMPMLK
jgi:dipeptidyl aminopeptidase/acylaminoacyl peptidase